MKPKPFVDQRTRHLPPPPPRECEFVTELSRIKQIFSAFVCRYVIFQCPTPRRAVAISNMQIHAEASFAHFPSSTSAHIINPISISLVLQEVTPWLSTDWLSDWLPRSFHRYCICRMSAGYYPGYIQFTGWVTCRTTHLNHLLAAVTEKLIKLLKYPRIKNPLSPLDRKRSSSRPRMKLNKSGFKNVSSFKSF